VYFRAGDDSDDILVWRTAKPNSWVGYWHHFVFVKSELIGEISIYFDGEIVDSNGTVNSTLANFENRALKIGAKLTHGYDYEGKMDDFQIYNRALNEADVRAIFRGGDLASAWRPSPFDGERDVPRDVTLSWQPGDYAVQHDVYFGNTFDDVNDAITLTPVIYIGRQADVNYTLPAPLQLGNTYYWRIDEVNNADANSPWKGKVWSFTVASYIDVDDFESYDPYNNIIWYTWANPYGTGSWIGLGTAPFQPVNQGDQSMEYPYDNTNQFLYGYYSETEYTFDTPQNWIDDDVKLITLFFYGDPGNDANSLEQMYIALEDNSTLRADIPYSGSMSDIQLDEWQEWNIALSDFAIDLLNVKKVCLGFGDPDAVEAGGEGTVYFDDIRIYPPKCVPQYGPLYDFSGDCLVGLAEIALMGEEWLLTDRVLDTIIPPDPCVLHYKFDETSGTTLADSANGYTGTYFDDLDQTPADITDRIDPGRSGNSFHFSSPLGYSGIMVPPAVFTDNAISQEISVAVWIKNAHPEEEPDGGAFMWEFRQWNGVATDANERVLACETTDDGDTYTLHDDTESTSYDLNWDRHTEWNHYSFVRDANNLKIYVNGYLESVSDSNGSPMAAPGLLYIGISADRAPGSTEDMHDGFTGNMDDFIIFDYALTDEQAGYLGTDGTRHIPLYATMNIFDNEAPGQQVVNLKDYAKLMLYWLEEILWP
jgi:hypothetical protein